MNSLHPGETLSLWLDTEEMPQFSKLQQDLRVDVCIIGGGIGGITTAYLLMKEGKKVCLLESFEIGSGQTGRTTAHFSNALDDRYYEIERLHGQEGARLAAQSHTAAQDAVEKIVREEKIDCHLERLNGYLFASDDDQEVLQKEFDAAHRAGLGIQFLNRAPLQSFDTGPCLRFPRQLQLHPLKYLSALTKIFVERGGQVFTHTHVTNVESGKIAKVKTSDGFTVSCNSLVVATNTPINDLFAIHTKQVPYRSYVVGFQIPKDSVPKGLFWDTLNPYHYVRIEQGETEDILIVGGEDHKTGQEEHPELCFTRLENWARQKFPMITNTAYSWSGQVMEPIDGLGYLGHNPMDRNNVYVITGDSGQGMTHCTIGGLLITDQIMGRANPWEQLYNPGRISVRATGEYLKINANVAAQYREWFSAKPRPELHTLHRGEGTVFRDGLRMVAAYKTTSGQVEFMSAACTHLAGVVNWNNVEKSWDCPCHGSRFDCHGKVLEGPATQALKPLDDVNIEIPGPERVPTTDLGTSLTEPLGFA
ncbi:MAG: FAD-dependent oxidoreductase [Bdellovibrionaceae bacterium]|nr:FAD-dependent oxidoreductase [Bdellovibrio sp.]